MKIAIMLALHNNPEQANIFIRQCLASPACDIFIHIDQKGLDIKEKLVKSERIYYLPKSYSVSWGDFTQIEYVIELIKYADSIGEYDYYSIHSGNDLMIKPVDELIKYLLCNKKHAYLDCHPLPWKTWQYGGGLGRLALTWPTCFRKRLPPHSIQRYARAIYGRLYGTGILRGKKLPEDIQFWGKSAWFTVSGECIKRALEYLRMHPEFLAIFERALCGDEIFFATLFNQVCDEDEVEEQNNLRYIDFHTKNTKTVGAPKTLLMEDKEKMMASGAFFARKVDITTDEQIIRFFVEYCLSEKEWCDL